LKAVVDRVHPPRFGAGETAPSTCAGPGILQNTTKKTFSASTGHSGHGRRMWHRTGYEKIVFQF
jgi:hypothetical protein